MDKGYIRIYRSLSGKAYYKKDSEKVHLWLHLLIKATHTEREELFGGKPVICKPGQFTTGRKQLSEETGINESKVERILTYFEKIEQQIEQRKSTSNRLISIVNWNVYQYTEQQNEQQLDNPRTTTEQQLDTLQESKEFFNDFNDLNIHVESFDSTSELSFENVWNLYGKKGNKKTSEQKWSKLPISKKKLALANIPLYIYNL